MGWGCRNFGEIVTERRNNPCKHSRRLSNSLIHISISWSCSIYRCSLNHESNLAIREDSSGRTALHLASAEGHLKTVQKLLEFKNEPCLVRDEQGRIPLHYAVMRGRTEVVQELIMERPESLSLGYGEENTVFHLCVTYNYLKTLETMVNLDYVTANITAGQPRGTIFRVRNTILHLTIMFKRVELRYIVLSFFLYLVKS